MRICEAADWLTNRLTCESTESINILSAKTSPSTVGGDLGNGDPHSASPPFADTEEAGGSTPPALTFVRFASAFGRFRAARSPTRCRL
jgi:hypothetical protein